MILNEKNLHDEIGTPKISIDSQRAKYCHH